MSADPTTPDFANSGSRVPSEVGVSSDELARVYQPRRVWGAVLSIGWNLTIAALFVFTGAAEALYDLLKPNPASAGPIWFAPLYLSMAFCGWAVLNFPLELWLGYLEERQFGLAKDGIRAWTIDWLVANLQHGAMFLVGSCTILLMRKEVGNWWLVPASGILLALMLMTSWLAADLLPRGLFSIQEADGATRARLVGLLPGSVGGGGRDRIPPILIYSHPSLREFAGGLLGLGGRQAMLLSRSTLTGASDHLLRFVLMHDLGHRHFRHNLLSTLAGWAWCVIGLAACDAVIDLHAPKLGGSPLYIAHLALGFTLWMALGEPVLAYMGRRLEYQADRYYLRHGGTWEEMRAALVELARRNLARTERLRRRQTIFHPLPSVANRLWAAKVFLRGRAV